MQYVWKRFDYVRSFVKRKSSTKLTINSHKQQHSHFSIACGFILPEFRKIFIRVHIIVYHISISISSINSNNGAVRAPVQVIKNSGKDKKWRTKELSSKKILLD